MRSTSQVLALHFCPKPGPEQCPPNVHCYIHLKSMANAVWLKCIACACRADENSAAVDNWSESFPWHRHFITIGCAAESPSNFQICNAVTSWTAMAFRKFPRRLAGHFAEQWLKLTWFAHRKLKPSGSCLSIGSKTFVGRLS